MTIKPAPDAVLQQLSCKCKKECVARSCTCMQNKFKCSVTCHSFSCINNDTTNGADDEDENLELLSDDDDEI